MRSHKKRRCLWTTEEDAKLIQQVEKHGPRQWSVIAQEMCVEHEGTTVTRTGTHYPLTTTIFQRPIFDICKRLSFPA